MPLSEHEQRLLEQMEQALRSEDPKFASHMVANPARSRARRRIALGVLGIVVGLGLVLIGAMVTQVLLAAVGFLAMVAGCAYAFMPMRRELAGLDENGRSASAHGSARRQAPKKPSSTGFMERLEQRWERRRHDGM